MPDFVKLINENYLDFDFHQNNVKRIIPPGEDTIVPWNIACTLFGNPRVPDIAPANERTRLYEKIRARHNFSAGLQTESEWETLRPRIKVFDIENDTEVVMLVDDPEGDFMPDTPTRKAISKETDVELLQRQVAALTNQITKLVASTQVVPATPGEGTTASPTAVEDSPGGAEVPVTTEGEGGASVDDVFNIPTGTETATQDNPQAVPVGEIEVAGDDTPPGPARKPVKKVAAKKVAGKK